MSKHNHMKSSEPVAEPIVALNVPRPGHVLVLRTNAADMTSRNGFKWPESGPVENVEPWDPTPGCGPGGLYGWLWGAGDADSHGAADPWASDAKWLVVEVLESEIVQCHGKVKFPRGTVVFCGERVAATAYLAEHGGKGHAIIGGVDVAGYAGTATAGYAGTATAGDGGTATAGMAAPRRRAWRHRDGGRWRHDRDPILVPQEGAVPCCLG